MSIRRAIFINVVCRLFNCHDWKEIDRRCTEFYEATTKKETEDLLSTRSETLFLYKCQTCNLLTLAKLDGNWTDVDDDDDDDNNEITPSPDDLEKMYKR